MKKCIQCSAEFERGSFCGKCGSRLVDIENVSQIDCDLDKTVAVNDYKAPGIGVTHDENKTVAVTDYSAPVVPTVETESKNVAQENFVPPQPAQQIFDENKTVATTDYSAPVVSPVVPPVAYQNVVTPANNISDKNVTKTIGFTQSQPDVQVYSSDIEPSYHQQQENTKKKKSKKPIIVFLVVLISILALAGTATAGFMTNWFGLVSPISPLLKAANATIKADNITVQRTIKIGEDGATTDEVATIRYNLEDELCYIAKGDDYKECLSGGNKYTVYDSKDKEPRKVESDANDVHQDINSCLTKDGIDYKKAIEKAGFENDVKAKEFEAFADDFCKTYLGDKAWLEKYLGFEKSKKEYIFTPDIQVLCTELIRIVDGSDAFYDESKESLIESIEDYAEHAKSHKTSIRVSITVKSGKISNANICVNDNHRNVDMNYAISDINKTEVGRAEIDEIVSEYDTYMAEHTCDDCGEFVHDYNKDYHGNCKECDTHGDINTDGLCFECIDKEKEVCKECGKETKTYEYDGKQLCKKCHEKAKEEDEKDKKEKEESERYCERCDSYEDLYYYSGGYYCFDCYLDLKYPDKYEETKYYCEWCGTKEYYSDMWYYDNYLLCWDCYEDAYYSDDYYYYCDWCDWAVDEVYYYNGDYLCWDCYEDAYYYDDTEPCDWCGGYFDYYDLYSYDGYLLCWDCYEDAYYDDDYGYCEMCGSYERMYYWDGSYYCLDCYWIA